MADFARALDISPALLSHYLSGRSKPGNKLQQKLRDLGCDIDWLMTGERGSVVREDESPYGQIKGWAPYLGRIVASPDGKEYFDDSGIPKGAGVPFFNDNSFTLEIDGDSLLNAEPIPIMPGDICVFESGRQPKNGDIVAVHLVDDRRMVKILRHLSKDEVELKSANKYRNYPAIKLRKKQIASYGIFITKLQLTDDAKQRFGLMKKGGKQ